jgi:hypothetical protein
VWDKQYINPAKAQDVPTATTWGGNHNNEGGNIGFIGGQVQWFTAQGNATNATAILYVVGQVSNTVWTSSSLY